MSEKLDFNIDSYNPETDSCFTIKSRMVGEGKLQLEVEFYGEVENIIISFLTAIQEGDPTKTVIYDIINNVMINRIYENGINQMNSENTENKGIKENKEENKDKGDTLCG